MMRGTHVPNLSLVYVCVSRLSISCWLGRKLPWAADHSTSTAYNELLHTTHLNSNSQFYLFSILHLVSTPSAHRLFTPPTAPHPYAPHPTMPGNLLLLSCLFAICIPLVFVRLAPHPLSLYGAELHRNTTQETTTSPRTIHAYHTAHVRQRRGDGVKTGGLEGGRRVGAMREARVGAARDMSADLSTERTESGFTLSRRGPRSGLSNPRSRRCDGEEKAGAQGNVGSRKVESACK